MTTHTEHDLLGDMELPADAPTAKREFFVPRRGGAAQRPDRA